MNRKEYGLLVEEWRKFINESDETSLRDLHLHRSRSGKVIEPLSVGKEETYKSGMVKTTLSLKDGGRGPAPAPRTGAARILNPFRLICAQLFVYGENLLTSPVGKTHRGRFKDQINRILDRKARILHTVLSADDATREQQLDVIFSVLQKYYPKLNDGRNNTIDYIRDNEEELKSYILKWKEMCKNSQIQDMCKEIVVALFAKGLLLEQLIGEDPNLDDETMKFEDKPKKVSALYNKENLKIQGNEDESMKFEVAEYVENRLYDDFGFSSLKVLSVKEDIEDKNSLYALVHCEDNNKWATIYQDDEGDQQIDDAMYDERRTKDNFNSKTN